jgi:hypothetical protein
MFLSCLNPGKPAFAISSSAILFVVSCFSFADRSALSQAAAGHAQRHEPDPAAHGLSALRLRLGLRAGPVALGRPARSLRIEARLRHRHHRLVHLRLSHRLRRLPRRQRRLHRHLHSPRALRPLPGPSFPATAASSPPGFPLPSAAAPPPSSTPRSISRCPSLRPSSDG